MYKGEKITVIIGAGGRGSRFGGPVPKQFLKIGEKTMAEMAITPFGQMEEIDEIVVVAPEEYHDFCKEFLERIPKLSKVVSGGKERQDSIRKGVEASTGTLLLVHDGARPFIKKNTIERVLKKAYEQGAAIPVVPVNDTLRQKVEQRSFTLDRNSIFAVQTPQGFRRALLKRAFEKAEKEEFYGTDEGALVERLGEDVPLVEGDFANIKITRPEDLPGEKRMDIRVGTGFDVHKLVEGKPLHLCGVEIPYEKGLLAHSDGDVGLHALMDALLGAAALGDIGKLFPDSDEKYRGISSTALLERVGILVRRKGYEIGNVDVTVICEKPKIARQIEAMRLAIGRALRIDKGSINVKGTTTEKLGFTGREEGIAAEAVCTLYKK